MSYKYELGNPLTDEIIEDIKAEAKKELLKELIDDWYNNKEKSGFGIRLTQKLRK